MFLNSDISFKMREAHHNDSFLSWISNKLDSSTHDKVVVYMRLDEDIKLLASNLQRYNPITLTTDDSISNIVSDVNLFNTDPYYRLIVISRSIPNPGALDDKDGRYPRHLVIDAFWGDIDKIQMYGTIYRVDTKSEAYIHILH